MFSPSSLSFSSQLLNLRVVICYPNFVANWPEVRVPYLGPLDLWLVFEVRGQSCEDHSL